MLTSGRPTELLFVYVDKIHAEDEIICLVLCQRNCVACCLLDQSSRRKQVQSR